MTIAEKIIRAKADIDNVWNNGYIYGGEEGYNYGYDDGYTMGYEDGVENGRLTENEEFWNDYLTKTSMIYGFAGSLWSAKTFRPPAGTVIQPTNATGLFMYSRMSIHLGEHFKTLGVTLDFSKCANLSYVFGSSYFTGVGEIKATGGINALTSAFVSADRLVTIEKLVLLNNGSNTFSSTFTGCSALKNITIEGVIGNNISFADCPLTAESAWSVAYALKDLGGYSGDIDNPKKLTVSSKTYDELNVDIWDEEMGDWNGNGWDFFYDHCDMIGWIVEVAR